jgi:hypothetical protein
MLAIYLFRTAISVVLEHCSNRCIILEVISSQAYLISSPMLVPICFKPLSHFSTINYCTSSFSFLLLSYR